MFDCFSCAFWQVWCFWDLLRRSLLILTGTSNNRTWQDHKVVTMWILESKWLIVTVWLGEVAWPLWNLGCLTSLKLRILIYMCGWIIEMMIKYGNSNGVLCTKCLIQCLSLTNWMPSCHLYKFLIPSQSQQSLGLCPYRTECLLVALFYICLLPPQVAAAATRSSHSVFCLDSCSHP